MKAWLLERPAAIESAPLKLTDLPLPEPQAGDVRVRVLACAMCRTDLHSIEGEIPTPTLPVIPGHQIVGVIDKIGENTAYLRVGDRIGIPWLHSTCGRCEFCTTHRENLCNHARFTGQHNHGGYAEYVIAPATFVYPLSANTAPALQAPLLCSGVIGYRALKLAKLPRGAKLGLYGFGSSAHITLKVAQELGATTYVITRGESGQAHSRTLGAKWAGGPTDTPPVPLDGIIIFAAAGELVPQALTHLKKGGTVVCAGIHMSDIPTFKYDTLWGERSIQSVANSTRADVRELLDLAARMKLIPDITVFDFLDMNANLRALKEGKFVGTGVVKIAED